MNNTNAVQTTPLLGTSSSQQQKPQGTLQFLKTRNAWFYAAAFLTVAGSLIGCLMLANVGAFHNITGTLNGFAAHKLLGTIILPLSALGGTFFTWQFSDNDIGKLKPTPKPPQPLQSQSLLTYNDGGDTDRGVVH